MENSQNLLKQLADAETSNWSTNYTEVLREARRAFRAGKLSECETLLGRLPTENSLLLELESKLKGKRLYQSLRQFKEGKITSRASRLKITSSLLTHCVIECEKGNTQFEMLIPKIVEQLNALAYGGSQCQS